MAEEQAIQTMNLKVSDNLTIPGLLSVYQSFDISNNYKSSVVAALSDIQNLNDLVSVLSGLIFNTLTIVDDSGETITTFQVSKLESINKDVRDGVQISLRFS